MEVYNTRVSDFLFIDDSGSKNWETPYSRDFVNLPPNRDENLNFWRNNYFVLAGVHVSASAIGEMNDEINNSKISFFGTKNVEIKSDWIRNPKQRRKKYIEEYSITEEKLKDFIENFWYPLFAKYADFLAIQAFVLDKRYFNLKRKSVTPYSQLVQVLFDRVEAHPNKNCTIVFDQMDADIKSKKDNHGVILKIAKHEIDLASYHKKFSHSGVRFEKSCNSNFLQIADTVAYNVYRQFVHFGHEWESPSTGTLPMYEYFAKISKFFYMNNSGRVSGTGIVLVPAVNKKHQWVRTKKPHKK